MTVDPKSAGTDRMATLDGGGGGGEGGSASNVIRWGAQHEFGLA